MPDEIVQQTAVYGIEPLEFSAFQLDFPSISPFLGDTWWLETMDFAGAPIPGSSGLQVGTPVPGSSGTQVGTPAPGSSGAEVGTPAPGSSGVQVGEPSPLPGWSSEVLSKTYPKPTLDQKDPVDLDPKSYGTSGREIGRIVSDDTRFEEFFQTYPVILDRVDDLNMGAPLAYMHLHLLSLPQYREDENFLTALGQYARGSRFKATSWFTDWMFTRPNILNGTFNNPQVYMANNVIKDVPSSLVQEQARRDREEGICPADPNQWDSNCSYSSGMYWNNNEFRRMKERTRWIWQQFQPDYAYLAADIPAWFFAGGHGSVNFPSFSNFDTDGGYPVVQWSWSKKREWQDPDFNPIFSYFDYMDDQLKLPFLSIYNPSPVLFRNYKPYSLPVFIDGIDGTPVMRVNAWVWNKSDIRALVY